ncbi:MAG: hypothetical protein ISS78_01230 [Phycisphaerae bacterium]|nr:hypothetical protein [Phycisphaerae bacterium]
MTTVVVAGLLVGFCAAGAADAAPDKKPQPIKDKTLVAWVYLANLTHRAGSALTLENPGGVFDAIVFGELATGKWMAGSNNWSRTQKQQNSYPAETADSKTLVQIAIAYKGKEVTTYRNGKKYAAYTMGPAPVEFSTNSVVVMGLRHTVNEQVGSFIEPGDDKALAKKVVAFITQGFKQHAREEIAAYARENFGWNNTVKNIEKIYAQVLEKI